ncbi:MAG: PAC2 family protein [Nostocoides sp.]
MQNPSELYRIETEAPLEHRPGVLVGALAGYIDAGQINHVLARHLLKTGDPEVIATFDVDQLLDYRGRRPAMVFDTDHYTSYEDPSLLLYRLTDRDGRSFYLLDGPEPDYQWERMVQAIRELMDAVGATTLVSAHGIPMGVPHTRPLSMTVHGTDSSLTGGAASPFGKVQLPSNFLALLELRLGEEGRPAVGWAVHVPHYLSQFEFSEGALTGLTAIAGSTGLNLSNDALVAAAGKDTEQISAQVAENDEVRAVVSALEQQYDRFVASQEKPSLLATDSTPVPTADELGAELEAFLRSMSQEESNDKHSDDSGPDA